MSGVGPLPCQLFLFLMVWTWCEFTPPHTLPHTCLPVLEFQKSSSESLELDIRMDESVLQSTPRMVALWPLQRYMRWYPLSTLVWGGGGRGRGRGVNDR